jgi:hypothetical protein
MSREEKGCEAWKETCHTGERGERGETIKVERD